MDKSLPTGKLSRGKVVGKALLKIGTKKSKRFLSNGNHAQTHKEIADVIFNALGELKGVSVKIAQQVALGMPFLPPTYLEKISKSFNNIPSINKALIRKIIKVELGAYPQDVFDIFDVNAFAAASLGQVHLATKGSEKIAVKVQYPGIKKSIASDMSLIHFGLKHFAKGQNVDHIISEIEERLYEEVDYTLEAKNYTFFKENMNNVNIVIPHVFTKLSSEKVLSTSFLEGLDFQSYLETNPSQKEKDAYAQLIFDSFFYSLYHLKHIHADPNPGNFLFMPEGKLGLIDFGCVKTVEEDFLKKYNQLHLNLVENHDDKSIIPQYIDLGMIEEQSEEKMQKFYIEVIKPLDTLYKEPLLNESYDFKENSDFSKRGFEMIFEVQKKQYHSVHKLNEQFIFINRTLLGYYALFEKMGAKIETKYVNKLMKEHQ
ncbi:MAG: Ubiquinone biosynthesis monooxygenase UbiB [uncultured Sulfurovum sp.]|uniref:Ubiquinone biosynthesis monooxygenase UbiB n=1 Tax=uncultured Sulfurovum sp. TaxID=269237 RepID=A0A6S6TNM8_9BACT|nr:MAG: Ubiquinone biosynthesis monooxygenase UbiB [uncultured Sulfurovum sp.]